MMASLIDSLTGTNAVLLGAGGAGLLLMVFMAVRFLSYRSRRSDPADLQFPVEDRAFCAERYQPMARLLDENDFEFLKAQPGYRPEIGARLRRERRRIFRMYLRDLSADFRRLHAEARRMLAHSPEHRGELVEMLIRQQLMFWRAMIWVELHLAGFGKADVTGLVQAMARMQSDLSRLSGPVLV